MVSDMVIYLEPGMISYSKHSLAIQQVMLMVLHLELRMDHWMLKHRSSAKIVLGAIDGTKDGNRLRIQELIILGPSLGNLIGNNDCNIFVTSDGSFGGETQQDHLMVM